MEKKFWLRGLGLDQRLFGSEPNGARTPCRPNAQFLATVYKTVVGTSKLSVPTEGLVFNKRPEPSDACFIPVHLCFLPSRPAHSLRVLNLSQRCWHGGSRQVRQGPPSAGVWSLAKRGLANSCLGRALILALPISARTLPT